MVDKK